MKWPLMCVAIALLGLGVAPSVLAAEPTMVEAYRLASGHSQQGNFAEAATHMAKALELAQRDLKPNDIQIGILARNLAQFHLQLEQDAEAENALQLAVSTYSAAHGEDAPELLPPLDELAGCLERLGANEQAYEVRKRILEITEKQSGRNSVAAAEAIVPVVRYLGRTERYDKADKYLRRAYKIWKAEKGAKSREAATALLFMGLNNFGQLEFFSGIERIEDAVGILEDVLPDGHPDKIRLYSSLLSVGERLSDLPFPTPDLFDIYELQKKLSANEAIAAEASSAQPPEAASAGPG